MNTWHTNKESTYIKFNVYLSMQAHSVTKDLHYKKILIYNQHSNGWPSVFLGLSSYTNFEFDTHMEMIVCFRV